ncbi:16535_t:CDS:2 [Acaulospora colombiana]|uniref:16535_t:CDS:1 n=1 Tax=Acaulospora colombiana TaxID=27376 RepID=A0ACA9MKX5_9GLOM|nr:16535_t:CDS:2 [Acaulospora colombiana]
MTTYDERVESFRPRKGKSSKKSSLNAFLVKGWPHPSNYKATPSSLAHAGFFFDPTSDKGDNVTCFMCDHSLGEWTQDDDPFVEHLNVNNKCAWALARCSIELDKQADGSFIFTVAARLPTAKGMEKARADTFKGHWIHDKVKGHTANSKKVATLTELQPTPAEPSIVEMAPPVSTASTSRTKSHAKTSSNVVMAPEVVEVATESDAPAPKKRGRPKKTTTTASTRAESPPPEPVVRQPAATSSKPSAPSGSKAAAKRVPSVSASAREDDDIIEQPIAQEDMSMKSTGSKGKKGKATKKKEIVTMDSDFDLVLPPPKTAQSVHEEQSVAASAPEESEDMAAKVPSKKKGAKKKAVKKSKTAPSVVASEDLATDDGMDVDIRTIPDADITPIQSNRVTMDSLGGWSSFQAANKELEDYARALHIEGEFAAIGKKPQKTQIEEATMKGKSKAGPLPTVASTTSKSLKGKAAQENQWGWREREKSVGSRSAPTEAEMTEEEEVEKSLAGDEDDMHLDEDDDNELREPSLPPSRATSIALSATASTTVSSKTKAKIKEVKKVKTSKEQLIVDPRMANLRHVETDEQATPKAKRPMQHAPPISSSLRTEDHPSHHAPPSAASDGNPFLLSAATGEAGIGGASFLTALEEPMLLTDANSHMLTEEEREMTLEEWIAYDVERRKEVIRKEGRRWIDTFLENAEAYREKIRAM